MCTGMDYPGYPAHLFRATQLWSVNFHIFHGKKKGSKINHHSPIIAECFAPDHFHLVPSLAITKLPNGLTFFPSWHQPAPFFPLKNTPLMLQRIRKIRAPKAPRVPQLFAVHR